MQVPLRGELTLPAAMSVHAPPTTKVALDSKSPDAFGNVLNHITRLSAPHALIPSIQVASPSDITAHRQPSIRPKMSPSMTLLGSTVALSKSARDTTSSWGNTASETASAEAALYPFLVHLAVAKDDVETLAFCLGIPPVTEATPDTLDAASNVPVSQSNRNLVKGGIANCLDIASGRTPLHVAGLNGSIKCTKILLGVGALIHIRDSLDHTALYYVSTYWVACSLYY